MIVRELITKLGFEVESSKFNQFDRQIGLMKGKLEGLDRNILAVADNIGRLGGKLTLALSLPLAIVGGTSIKAAADMEQLQLSFEVMLGSAEKGITKLKELLQFAAKTPFEIKDIGPTAKQLLGMGIESEKLIDTMTFLGDVSAGLNVPLTRLALNFGQVKTQGKLTGRELRDFAVGGVPLLDELAKIAGKSKAEVQKMISAGQIGFPMVEQAFRNMTSEGGRFENLMGRMSLTLGGLFSNFLDNLFLARIELGKEIAAALNLKEAFRKLNEFLDKAVERFKSMSSETKRFIVFTGIFLTAVGPGLIVLGGFLKAMVMFHKMLILIKGALFAASGAAGIFNLSMFLTPALILLAVAAFALFVEDVMTWIRGGKSLTGKLLGPWEDFAVGFKTIWNGLSDFLDELFLSMFTGNFDKVIEDLKKFKKTMQFLIEDMFGVSPISGTGTGVGGSKRIDPLTPNPIKAVRQIIENLSGWAGSMAGGGGRQLVTLPSPTGKSLSPINIKNEFVISGSGTPTEMGAAAGSQFLEGFNRQIRHALSTEVDTEGRTQMGTSGSF